MHNKARTFVSINPDLFRYSHRTKLKHIQQCRNNGTLVYNKFGDFRDEQMKIEQIRVGEALEDVLASFGSSDNETRFTLNPFVFNPEVPFTFAYDLCCSKTNFRIEVKAHRSPTISIKTNHELDFKKNPLCDSPTQGYRTSCIDLTNAFKYKEADIILFAYYELLDNNEVEFFIDLVIDNEFDILKSICTPSNSPRTIGKDGIPNLPPQYIGLRSQNFMIYCQNNNSEGVVPLYVEHTRKRTNARNETIKASQIIV